ncbi:Putative gamma-glutamyltransferase ywrD [Cedecea neteri]|uniref:Gamma-glutamyltransferase ywrD n=1 Tax=Cedecea neteri TaxID=158822 RepID=A0A2X2SYX9_9ENTR|nr:Putative gamma-glutamyltransferase ywrD [Cedecea neteri]
MLLTPYPSGIPAREEKYAKQYGTRWHGGDTPSSCSESALSVLRHGGDAIEAMVAAAAAIAVVYPHMNGIGGDGFWLIVRLRENLSPSTPAGLPVPWRHWISTGENAPFPIAALAPR